MNRFNFAKLQPLSARNGAWMTAILAERGQTAGWQSFSARTRGLTAILAENKQTPGG